jgi:hypothetical protein
MDLSQQARTSLATQISSLMKAVIVQLFYSCILLHYMLGYSWCPCQLAGVMMDAGVHPPQSKHCPYTHYSINDAYGRELAASQVKWLLISLHGLKLSREIN